jgi:hypothetical protein
LVKKIKKIRDASCCPGVLIQGGVHTGPETKTISDNTLYAALLDLGFIRTSQDLCLYYRDSGSSVSWKMASPSCTNGTYVDSEDNDGNWRLPNIAELGYIHDLVRTGNGLKDQPGADTRTENFKPQDASGYAYPYWSSTRGYDNEDKGFIWRFFTSSNYSYLGTWYVSREGAVSSLRRYYYSARCVRTMD